MTLSEIEEERENNFKRSAETELTKMIQISEWKKDDREWFLNNHPKFTDC